MRFLLISIVVCISSVFTPEIAVADKVNSITKKPDANSSSLIERMKAGGHILIMRHANAPGHGDPKNFKIGDCSTQRNLDEKGRKQAHEIAKWLHTNDVSSARVYSSQWCRCLDTAELLELGEVEEMPALNSFYEMPQNRESSLKALRKFITEQPSDGELIVLVTHFVTITSITNKSVSTGQGVLLKLNEGAPFKVVGKFKLPK